MKTRVLDGKLKYLISIYQSKKEILIEIVNDMEEKGRKWWMHVKKYVEECEMMMRVVKRCTKEDIKKKTREWDTCKWKSEMESKESLALYGSCKKEINSPWAKRGHRASPP